MTTNSPIKKILIWLSGWIPCTQKEVFIEGGWYEGRQYMNGTFGERGVLHPDYARTLGSFEKDKVDALSKMNKLIEKMEAI